MSKSARQRERVIARLTMRGESEVIGSQASGPALCVCVCVGGGGFYAVYADTASPGAKQLLRSSLHDMGRCSYGGVVKTAQAGLAPLAEAVPFLCARDGSMQLCGRVQAVSVVIA